MVHTHPEDDEILDFEVVDRPRERNEGGEIRREAREDDSGKGKTTHHPAK